MKIKRFVRGELIFGLFLAGWGASRHLALGKAWSDPHLLGDRGDGYLIFYLLEHVRKWCIGEVDALARIPIFWPEEATTLWWSDNFILPGCLHAGLTAITGSPETSAHLSILLWTFIGFVASWWLFSELLLGLRTDLHRPGFRGLNYIPPALAYCVSFSLSRLQTLGHFHNLSSVILIILITCAFRHLRKGRTLDMVGMAAAECALFYFSPYQALLGIVILSAWGFSQLCLLSVAKVKALSLQALFTLPFIIASGWIVLQYVQVAPREYDLIEVASRSAGLGNYLRPLGPAQKSHWFATVFPGGYLGAGIICGGLLTGIVWLLQHRTALRTWSSSTWVWGWLVLLGISFIRDRDLRDLTLWFRLMTLILPVVCWGWILRSHEEGERRLPWFFLGLATVLVVGLTFGPSLFFVEQMPNPSIWGIYSLLIPGVDSMRDLMRFTATAQVLILACLVGTGFTLTRNPKVFLVILILCCGIQIMEMGKAQPKMVRAATIPPMPSEEKAFWENHTGSLLAVPSTPFHENTRWMLRFQEHPGIVLVNGYSGRSSELFDAVMESEALQGPGGPQTIQIAEDLNMDYLYLLKRAVQPERLNQLRETYAVLYESQSFLVLSGF